MKNITRTLLVALAVFTSTLSIAIEPASQNEKLIIDTDKSTIVWKGEKVTGEHSGTISIKSGSLELKGDKLIGGDFIIDMTSIACTDLDGEYKGKLEGHLKSDDFFGVRNFPEAGLVIKKATENDKPGSYTIVAELTIKGITNDIKFTATLISDNGVVVANSNIIIDRTKFDIKYGSGSFFDNLGDKTIYDDFTLTVNLVTK